jgi:hypothetical protein
MGSFDAKPPSKISCLGTFNKCTAPSQRVYLFFMVVLFIFTVFLCTENIILYNGYDMKQSFCR